MTRLTKSREILAALYRAALADGIPVAVFLEQIKDAYPFGERAHSPYRIWRGVAREYETRYAYDVKYKRVVVEDTDGV